MSIVELMQRYKKNDIDEDDLVRAIVRHPDWYVVVDANNCALLWTIQETNYLVAMAGEEGPYEKTHQYMCMRGRHLLKHLPDDAGGVAFELGRPEAIGWERADFGPLVEVANALDVEDAYREPGPDQVELFRQHPWYFLCQQGVPEVVDYRGKRVVCMFTAADVARRFFTREPQYKHLDLWRATGAELFAALVERDDYDGVWMNPHAELEWEPFGPGYVFDWHEGREPRPEVGILKARSVADIHQFLDLENMSREGRRHTLEYVGEELVAHYQGTMIGRDARSYRFFPVEPLADPLAFGDGPATLWCMGKVADLVRRRLANLPKKEEKWLSSEERDYLAGMVRWIDELIKWLATDGDTLPRRCFRSADGARFVREFPHIATRSWLLEMRDRGEALLQTLR